MLTKEDYDEMEEILQQFERVFARHAKNRDDEILTVQLRVATLEKFIGDLRLKAAKRKASASAMAGQKRKTRKR